MPVCQRRFEMLAGSDINWVSDCISLPESPGEEMDYPVFISIGDWLDSIKMSQYKSNFMAASYNTLDSVARMSIEWVEEPKYNHYKMAWNQTGPIFLAAVVIFKMYSADFTDKYSSACECHVQLWRDKITLMMSSVLACDCVSILFISSVFFNAYLVDRCV